MTPPRFCFSVIRTDREGECAALDDGLRAAGGTLTKFPDGTSEDVLIEAVRDTDLLITCYAPISARVIAAARKLKGIVKCGVSIDNIDVAAAMQKRIPVVNVPDYAEETVAEGAFALMIALMKKTAKIDRAMRERGWVWPEPEWRGLELAGKTIGLVGVGRIGRSMARMAGAGFRMRVLGYSPRTSAEEMKKVGIEKRDDLRAMLAECDVVSVHATLSQDTFHLLGEAEFSAMKPTCLFINTARGAIADEKVLLRTLQEGRIGGAALDVYGQEPLNRESHFMRPLYKMDNVILFPHLTFYTAEAMARLEQETLARCLEIVEGRPVLVKSQDRRLRAQTHGVTFS